jgi:hypothetical protein
MSDLAIAVSDEARAEIARAFRELRPDMIENAAADRDLDPASRFDEFRAEDLEQFLNAYEAMFMEALEGQGRGTRDLILETALPPVVDEMGQTARDMVRGNVVSAVMLAHRLLPLVREDLRDDAARWLASFLSGYSHEVVGRVLALEADRP